MNVNALIAIALFCTFDPKPVPFICRLSEDITFLWRIENNTKISGTIYTTGQVKFLREFGFLCIFILTTCQHWVGIGWSCPGCTKLDPMILVDFIILSLTDEHHQVRRSLHGLALFPSQ
jgi:hypothetical protein